MSRSTSRKAPQCVTKNRRKAGKPSPLTSEFGDIVRSCAKRDPERTDRIHQNARLLDRASTLARRLVVLEGFLYDFADAPVTEYDGAIEELMPLADSKFEVREQAFETAAKLHPEFEAVNGEALDDAVLSQAVSAARAGFALGLAVGRVYGATVEKGAVRS